jgi:hypothetical protein
MEMKRETPLRCISVSDGCLRNEAVTCRVGEPAVHGDGGGGGDRAVQAPGRRGSQPHLHGHCGGQARQRGEPVLTCST